MSASDSNRPAVRLASLKLAVLAVGLVGLAPFGCGLGVPGSPLSPERLAGAFGFGNAAPPTTPQADEAADADAAVRAIEEADILKIADGRAYALHRTKGLFILDVSDPDAPALLGSLAFSGQPIEMYVVGERVYAVLSSVSAYAYGYGYGGAVPPGDVFLADDSSSSVAPPYGFDGSKVAIIDISDLAAPRALGSINLVGYAANSRRVGDVIYVVGNEPAYYDPNSDSSDDADFAPRDYTGARSFVAAINVADPAHILAVDRKTFAGSADNIHVSQTALFAAASYYDYDRNLGPLTYTRVQYVDISDPAGQIVVRGALVSPGTIRNRFYMGDFNGVFRIVTDESAAFGFRRTRIFTHDVSDPDNIQPLGEAEIMRGESLEAVRFDGTRGYAVTFLRTDPLFVLDLADPANPRVAGELEVPGYSTHIEPRGDRLIAVGIDDTDGFRPAVALYNVADPAAPSQLARIILGPPGSYTESDATYDEKAFKIVDQLGLIAVPFRHYEVPAPGGGTTPPAGVGGREGDAAVAPYQPACVNGVQLIDWIDDTLVQRGAFEHPGNVERVGVIGSRAYAFSQAAFATYNIDDRDHPAALGSVPFVSDDELPYYLCGGGYYGIFEPPLPIDFFDNVFMGFDPALLLALVDVFGTTLAQTLAQEDVCGAMAPLPGVAMLAGLAALRFIGPRRRARR